MTRLRIAAAALALTPLCTTALTAEMARAQAAQTAPTVLRFDGAS